MLEEARIILRQVERAQDRCAAPRAAARPGGSNIGSSGGTYFHPLIPRSSANYRSHYPDIVVFPAASNTPLLSRGCRPGKSMWPAADADQRTARASYSEQLVDEPTVIVVPSGHPLSARTSVPLSALAEETFVLFPREINPSNYDSIIAACIRAGFLPRLERCTRSRRKSVQRRARSRRRGRRPPIGCRTRSAAPPGESGESRRGMQAAMIES